MFFDQWFHELVFLEDRWQRALKAQDHDVKIRYEQQVADHFFQRYPDVDIFARRLIGISRGLNADLGQVLSEIWGRHHLVIGDDINGLVLCLSSLLQPFTLRPELLSGVCKLYDQRTLESDYTNGMFSPMHSENGTLAYYNKQWPGKDDGGFGAKGAKSFIRFDIRPETLCVCFGAVAGVQENPVNAITPMVEWLMRDTVGQAYREENIRLYVHSPWNISTNEITEEFDRVVSKMSHSGWHFSLQQQVIKPHGLDEAFTNMPDVKRIERDTELVALIQQYTRMMGRLANKPFSWIGKDNSGQKLLPDS